MKKLDKARTKHPSKSALHFLALKIGPIAWSFFLLASLDVLYLKTKNQVVLIHVEISGWHFLVPEKSGSCIKLNSDKHNHKHSKGAFKTTQSNVHT